jgi:hypothetical protein
MDYVELFQTQTKEQVSQLIKDELANRALETLGDIQKEYVSEELKKETIKVPTGTRPKGVGWGLKRSGQQRNEPTDTYERKYKALSEESLTEMSDEDFDALVEDYEQLDELSKTTLASYVKKASRDAKSSGYKAGYSDADSVAHTKGSMEKKFAAGSAAAAEDDDKAHKRLKGIDKAMTKIMKEKT